MRLPPWSAAALAVLAGCAAMQEPALPMVRARAEKDLRCAGDNLEVEEMIGGKYRVDGCGRTAVYDTVCDNVKCSVSLEGEEAPAWRDRADPGTLENER
jgi:hypothetical protein